MASSCCGALFCFGSSQQPAAAAANGKPTTIYVILSQFVRRVRDISTKFPIEPEKSRSKNKTALLFVFSTCFKCEMPPLIMTYFSGTECL
jgi:hypothetical protein